MLSDFILELRDAPMPKRTLLDRRTNEPVNVQTTKFSAVIRF